MTMRLHLICDESGAKGYDDGKIELPGDVGVMAGFLVPDSKLAVVRSDLDNLVRPYQPAGKLHVTDLTPQEQEELRSLVFKYLGSAAGSPCLIYEAIHEAGFNAHGEALREKVRALREGRRSSVAISANPYRALLHAELLMGIYGKAVAFCRDRFGDEKWPRKSEQRHKWKLRV